MKRFFSYSDPLYFHPVLSSTMSGRRYQQILRVICCSPPGSRSKGKVQPLIDMLIARFQSVYGPGKELSLDESLLHFRGRLGFRVYIKNKKNRYGIKFFEVTTSDGYLLNMEMYNSGAQAAVLDNSVSKTTALVLRLLEPYIMKGHHIFMDNYYNSYELSKKLLNLRTHTNGTLRANRKNNPKKVMASKLKRGEHIWQRRGNVYVSKWKDKRDVLVITTLTHPRLVTTKNKFGKEYLKPEEVVTYNDHMSGIDRCDQMTSTYSSPRKTLRWYKKVLFHLLDVSVWNAFYIYRKYFKGGNRKYSFLQFRDDLIKCLINLPENIETKSLVRTSRHSNRRFQIPLPEENVGHWPEKIPGVPGPKSGKKYVFLNRRTSFRCKGCVGKPPLCPSCFEE